MNDFTEKEIKKAAYAIYIRAGGANRKYGDQFSDYLMAKNQLEHDKEFKENYTRGSCGD